jgi:hypothetical protein
MGEQICTGEGGRLQSVGVLSGTVELLCWWEKNVKVSGFRLAAIKRNTHNDLQNKENKIVGLINNLFYFKPQVCTAHLIWVCTMGILFFFLKKG